MMEKNSKNLTVIVGLGKTGMSCVRHLQRLGVNVAVVDSRANPPGLNELITGYPEVPIYLNGWHENLLAEASQLIVSPGVAISTEAIAKQAACGIPVIGDIELFAKATTKPVIAITGSNGKSTVTSLVGKMAQAAECKVGVGGNLGTPALDLLNTPEPELYVLELSSFQLETTYSLQASAATILNVTPDHLDRYPTIDDYAAAKLRIFTGCKTAVINRDNNWFLPQDFTKKLNCLSFGLGKPKNASEFGVIDDYLALGANKLIAKNDLLIKGEHQIANALAALALGYAAGLSMTAMLEALRVFPGLEHRCQWVTNTNGVDWFNDSKGTNVGATEAAISGLGASIKGKIVLIAGGQGKGADFTCLTKAVKNYVRTLILIGVDAPKIAQDLSGTAKILRAESMAEAVSLAKQEAISGDSVLLSPACASFDMFNNFEHRGQVFIDLVKNG